jgi:hypothetical protein
MKKNNGYLKIAIFFALFVVLLRFGEFAVSRIPPYKEGQCLVLNMGLFPVKIKILENDLLEGVSVVTIERIVFEYKEKVPFSELRSVSLEKVACDE